MGPAVEPLPQAATAAQIEQMPDLAEEQPTSLDQTTLLQNEEESFALAPIDASALKGTCCLHILIIVERQVYFVIIRFYQN